MKKLDRITRLFVINGVVSIIAGVVLGVLLTVSLQHTAPIPTYAQTPQRLMGTHPTTGRAIPISTTAEGYINVKVIP